MPPFRLRQLRHLDQSSPEFPSHLARIFHEQGYRDCIESLQDDDSTWLIEYLDNGLRVLATNPTFWPCLWQLREICGRRRMVPQSCVLPRSPPITARWPVASKGYCDIYEGTHDDSKVRVKRLRMYSSDKEGNAKHTFCREVVLWKYLDHPNILPLIGTTSDPLQALSVWIAGGVLSEYITAHPHADRLSIISDVAAGLSYLHSHGVVHGDLKGPSILVDSTDRAFLTDFGFAEIVLDSGCAGSIRDGHAVRWAAPEILDKQCPVSRKSDVYSFAMVAIETFTGQAPFFGIGPTTVGVGVLARKRPPRPTHQCLTDELWKMIECCWDQDPQRRPNISEVVLCLRAAPALTRNHSHTDSHQTQDETSSVDSVRVKKLQMGMHFRPSRWAPHIFQRLREFCPTSRPTSDTEPIRNAQSGGYEKTLGSESSASGREGFSIRRYSASRCPRAARPRSQSRLV